MGIGEACDSCLGDGLIVALGIEGSPSPVFTGDSSGFGLLAREDGCFRGSNGEDAEREAVFGRASFAAPGVAVMLDRCSGDCTPSIDTVAISLDEANADPNGLSTWLPSLRLAPRIPNPSERRGISSLDGEAERIGRFSGDETSSLNCFGDNLSVLLTSPWMCCGDLGPVTVFLRRELVESDPDPSCGDFCRIFNVPSLASPVTA